MGVVAFNGNSNLPQPSTVKEERIRHVYDKTSITGRTRRVWHADKKQVVLTFEAMSIAQYNQIAAYVFNQANPVTYSNAVTGFNFTGFTTVGEDTFIPGNLWLKNLSVTILEL